MDNLNDLNKEQLREQAGRRQLPVSGTNDELIARIRQWDLDHEDDPLGAGGGDDDPPEVLLGEAEAAKPAEAKPKSFITMFPCPGELSTGVHQENCDRTIYRAQSEGHQVRGVAHRIDFTVREGQRYAVYEVHLAREHSNRRY